VPFVAQQLAKHDGPVIASTDYMKNYAEQIRPFMPKGRTYKVLGTDGFGRSDFRSKLREHFEINRHYIVVAALKALSEEGAVPVAKVAEALKQYGIYHYLEKTTKEEDTISFLRNFIHNIEVADNKQHDKIPVNNPFTSLSARELEVLHYMLGGHGTKDISSSLNLRMNTVSTLKTRIFEKTDTKNLKELMQLASLYNVN
jgi:FixJ family two-component response regulator